MDAQLIDEDFGGAAQIVLTPHRRLPCVSNGNRPLTLNTPTRRLSVMGNGEEWQPAGLPLPRGG
jgi:hypothetical protein